MIKVVLLLLKLCFREYCFDRQGRLIFHLCTKTCSVCVCVCVCMCMQHTQHAADIGSSRPACRDFPPHQAPPIKLNHSLKLNGNFAKLQKILCHFTVNLFRLCVGFTKGLCFTAWFTGVEWEKQYESSEHVIPYLDHNHTPTARVNWMA